MFCLYCYVTNRSQWNFSHTKLYIWPHFWLTRVNSSGFDWCLSTHLVLQHQQTVCDDNVIKWKYFPCHWPFVREFHRWIPLTKANDAELWCFVWSVPEKTVEQTTGKLMIRDAIALIMTSLYVHQIHWSNFLLARGKLVTLQRCYGSSEPILHLAAVWRYKHK